MAWRFDDSVDPVYQVSGIFESFSRHWLVNFNFIWIAGHDAVLGQTISTIVSLPPFLAIHWFCVSSTILTSPFTISGEFLDVIEYGIDSKGSLMKMTEGKATVVLCLM